MKAKKLFNKVTKGFMVLVLTVMISAGVMYVTSNAVTYISSGITLSSGKSAYETSAEYEEAGKPIFRMHVSNVTDGYVKISNTIYKQTLLWYSEVETVTASNISGPKYIDFYYCNNSSTLSAGYKYFKIQVPYFSNSNAKVTINGGYTRMQ